MSDGPNWVEGRYNCSALYVLKQLHQQVVDDVAQANEKFAREKIQFKVGLGPNNKTAAFFVRRTEYEINAPHFVTFKIEGDRIAIRLGKDREEQPKSMFWIDCQWDEQGCKCNLVLFEEGYDVSNECYKIWQISQRALHDLFFVPDLDDQ